LVAGPAAGMSNGASGIISNGNFGSAAPTLAMKALSVHALFQLRLQPRHGGLALRQRRPLEQRTVHMNIVPGHARSGKALLESLPHRAPIERENLRQHPD